MEECSLSFYDREADRLKTKVEGLVLNVDDFRLKPNGAGLAASSQIQPPESIFINYADEEILDVDEDFLSNANCWHLNKSEGGHKGETSNIVSLGGDLAAVDATDVIRSLKEVHLRQLPPAISTKTFARPKKGRSSLGNLVCVTPPDVGSPKLRRRLTTTIDPSPALIPHLEQLSRTNNRPLSNCEDLNWEDGAAEGEAPADAANCTPRRPDVPPSLLQRLQELKETNSVRSPFLHNNRVPPAMTVSQMMRDIPDLESAEPESYFSLGDTSFLNLGDVNLGLSRNADGFLPEGHRMTFGGIELPPGRTLIDGHKTFVMVDQLVEVSELNSTYTKDEQAEEEKENSKLYVTNPVYDEDNGDENRNTDANKVAQLLKNYSSQLFDTTFQKKEEKKEVKLHETFRKEGVELNIFDTGSEVPNGDVAPIPSANGTFTCLETPAYNRVEYVAKTASRIMVSESNIKQVQSKEELNDTVQYSTATYTRPSARFSPARSGLPMRRVATNSPGRRVSTEDLARSPARSDGTITPVDTRPAYGTYTRNSPVDRCGSEDEQMSTTSDHSLRSLDSVEDLPERCKVNQPGKRQVSTPRVSAGSVPLDELQMSPITHHHHQLSPISSSERTGSAVKVLNKIPHGPVPLKPALIRPTENFKRPVLKKNETNATNSMRAPVKPAPLSIAVSALPKPATRPVSTRIPTGRLSSIPRPPSARTNRSN